MDSKNFNHIITILILFSHVGLRHPFNVELKYNIPWLGKLSFVQNIGVDKRSEEFTYEKRSEEF